MTSPGFRSVLAADLRENGMRTSQLAVLLFRVSQHVPWPLSAVVRVLLVYVLDVDIPPRTRVGPGLVLGHGGRGVVVHPDSVLGRDVWLNHRVTIAQDPRGAPTLDDGVQVGTGAVVIGRVTLGARSAVTPNSVVRGDLPAGVIAAGNPAVVVARRSPRAGRA